MLSDMSGDCIVWNKRHPAQFPALTNSNETPPAQLFAFIVVTSPKPKVWITARLRESEKLRAGLRRSLRAFGSRLLSEFSDVHNDLTI